MKDILDNRHLLEVIRKNFLHLAIIGVAAILLSALFSSPRFIKPRFKSTTRIYPVNLARVSMESESEQMLEIINSNDIKSKMFDVFKLDEVYKIPKKDPHYLTNIMAEYNSRVKTNKTEFETVEITVMDNDPQRASDMCDSIIHFYNDKVRQMHTVKNWELVNILQLNMDKRRAERDSVHQLIKENREKYQILDFPTQVKEVTRGYMEALASGRDNTSGGKEIRQLYDNLSEKGGEALILEGEFRKLNKTLDSLKFLYDLNLSEATKKITYCFIVEKPVPADKKSYPVRWMIVALTTISALFLALLLFTFLDYRKSR